MFFRLALRIIKDFKLETHRIHFDTTTVTLSGTYEGSRVEPRITFGYNKDHRPDLKPHFPQIAEPFFANLTFAMSRG